MKFAVGYQLFEGDGEEPCLDWIREYSQDLEEVYFPWADIPSGRAPLATRRGCTDWSAQRRLEADLREIRGLGLKLDLLLNANCLGGRAISQHLENQTGSLLNYLEDAVGGINIVTTASPFIARTVKKHFPKIETRASVNMRLGTTQAMGAAADLFDGFYVQRDYNRDLEHLARLKSWGDQREKKLLMLANSGCLRFCPGQTFHDNLVAHEAEVDEMRNVEDWNPHVCRRLFRDRQNWPAILQATWVRPEDLHHYEDLFPVVKLATRMHSHPRLVVHAYTRRRHYGNLLDLFEPGYSSEFMPYIIDNQRFPDDWFERSSACQDECMDCDYCRRVLQQVLA